MKKTIFALIIALTGANAFSQQDTLSCDAISRKANTYAFMQKIGIASLAGGSCAALAGGIMLSQAHGATSWEVVNGVERGNPMGGFGSSFLRLGVTWILIGGGCTLIGTLQHDKYKKLKLNNNCAFSIDPIHQSLILSFNL